MRTCAACGVEYADDAPHAEFCAELNYELDDGLECSDCFEVFDTTDEFDEHDCPAWDAGDLPF